MDLGRYKLLIVKPKKLTYTNEFDFFTNLSFSGVWQGDVSFFIPTPWVNDLLHFADRNHSTHGVNHNVPELMLKTFP